MSAMADGQFASGRGESETPPRTQPEIGDDGWLAGLGWLGRRTIASVFRLSSACPKSVSICTVAHNQQISPTPIQQLPAIGRT